MENAVYRIIDANFNRAREAARVAEEYCRFYLNSPALTARVKQLRHQLSDCISKLDPSQLITNRDTLADVGVGQTIKEQMTRENLHDTLTAACKRLPEALRALTETIKTFDPHLAERIETLRYNAYTLEKDIFIAASTLQKFKKVSLYIVITSDLPAEILTLTAKCIAGGADCIQMRTKKLNDDQIFALACQFVALCRESNVVSIVNDRPDIAIASCADGVHVGQNDLPAEQIRKLARYPLIIGKSTHSPDQLKAAINELVTYAALGPVFATPTKPTAPAVGLEYVKHATAALKETSLLHVAIGGINAENVGQVIKAGARCIAVCSAVTDSPDPTAACHKLKEKITTAISAE